MSGMQPRLPEREADIVPRPTGGARNRETRVEARGAPVLRSPPTGVLVAVSEARGTALAIGAAVRLANRYKELQVEGYAPPLEPLVRFPPDFIPPWANVQPINVGATLVEGGAPEDER
jgi:hypothetical protein